jgi:putative DNA primase/helicase
MSTNGKSLDEIRADYLRVTAEIEQRIAGGPPAGSSIALAESAEARQAVEAVRLFIEAHGDARFASVDDADARPVANRAGYRKGSGAEREWWILPEVWRTEICAGHNAHLVARVLADAGMLRRQAEGLQCKVRVGSATYRCYVVTAAIFEGAADAG